MSGRSDLDLQGFVKLLRTRRLLILGTALLTAVLAFGISMAMPAKYEASADLLFRAPEPAPRIDPTEPPLDSSSTPERAAATNLALASLDQVVVRVKDSLRSPETAEELRGRVELAPQGQADLLTVTASGDSSAAAARLANAFADEVVELRREAAQQRVQDVIDAIRGQLATVSPDSPAAERLASRADALEVERELRAGEVEVAQQATPPRDQSSPRPLRNGVIGGFFGLFLGILLALVLRTLDRRVETEEDVVEIFGAPLLARIPAEKPSVWEQQVFLESFQFLRSNLQLRDAKRRVLAVTSARPANGKSTVAARLAEALAVSGSTVIAVDCDLRRPTLHTHFDVDPVPGVTGVVTGELEPLDALQSTGHPGLRLMAAGPQVDVQASALTGAQRLDEILDQLRGEADYVIVDTAPITIGAEASALAAAVDGVLVVVDMAASEQRKVLMAAAAQLGNTHARVVGVVLNRCDVLLPHDAYRSYYQPGVKPDPSRETRADPVAGE